MEPDVSAMFDVVSAKADAGVSATAVTNTRRPAAAVRAWRTVRSGRPTRALILTESDAATVKLVLSTLMTWSVSANPVVSTLSEYTPTGTPVKRKEPLSSVVCTSPVSALPVMTRRTLVPGRVSSPTSIFREPLASTTTKPVTIPVPARPVIRFSPLFVQPRTVRTAAATARRNGAPRIRRRASGRRARPRRATGGRAACRSWGSRPAAR